MSKLKVLDLFSGIGGFALGLERTGGFETVAFCEIEPYCRKVLAKHWPGVKCYDDVRTLSADALYRDGIAVDVITGGFPCQDISFAGKGAGIEGERSGLWGEYARLIGELRPQYVIVENVAALLVRGLGRVLGDLAALGLSVEWHCIPASYVGAPHRRDRIWIVADAGSEQHQSDRAPLSGQIAEELSAADAAGGGCGTGRQGRPVADGAGQSESEQSLHVVANTNGSNGHRRAGHVQMGWGRIAGRIAGQIAQDGDARGIKWLVEPELGRVAHGISYRVDRLKGLGNAVVPQIPELIGRAILAQLSAGLARREAAE